MKIQNTEMEFVAFDAQDVIATSGPLAETAHFTFGESLFGGEGIYFCGTYWNNPGVGTQQFHPEDGDFEDGITYQITKGVTGFSEYNPNPTILGYDGFEGNLGEVILTNVNEGSGGKELSTLIDIVNWLKGSMQ